MSGTDKLVQRGRTRLPVRGLLALGLLLLGVYRLGFRAPRGCQRAPDVQALDRQHLGPPPWQTTRDCKVYILDVSETVAPAAGLPQCDINDPKVWPLAEPGELPWDLQRMESMPHMNYVHAGQYWLTQALRNASGVLTDNIDEACLVWVDMYCYNQWFLVYRAITRRKGMELFAGYSAGDRNIEKVLLQAWEHIIASPRFKKRQGRDYVIHVPLPNPGRAFTRLMCTDLLYAHTLIKERALSCANKGRPKVLLREAQLVPYNAVADVDLSSPVVGSRRPTFVYMKATCGAQETAFCGKVMRQAVVSAFGGKASDIEVACAGGPDVDRTESASHAGTQREMRRSVFCIMTPGDLPSTGRLTEVLLAGCIPVFVGAPWHELPFNHGEVDWASFSIFLAIKEAVWLDPNITICKAPLIQWDQSADVKWATVSVASMEAALAYLRGMPNEAIERRQAALEHARRSFYYPAAPGMQTSAAADIIFSNLIRYGQRLKAQEFVP